MLICVGEFFGIDVEMNQKVIDGKLEFPITTYVLGEHFLVFLKFVSWTLMSLLLSVLVPQCFRLGCDPTAVRRN
uniref:Uncharacterized protein n=1 Tax=Parascaris equorum TaxID=6256 RepID=A0A914SA84_PAREQ